MRVLLVGPNIYEKNKLGGIITVVNLILDVIKEISYFSRSPEKTNKFYKNLFSLVIIFFKFNRKLKSEYKIVHLNSALETSALFRDVILSRIAIKNKTKILLHLHGGKYFNYNPNLINKKLIEILLKSANKILVLSKKEQQVLKEKYKLENVSILENAINLSQIPNKSYTKNFNRLSLIYLGRIAPNKGLEDILNALKILKNENIDFTYYLYGNGSILEDYKLKCKEDLGNSFKYMGVVSGKDKWFAYQNSNVFLLPSLFEGLPMSLLEAMATGNICITTKVGSIPEVVGDLENGIFVNKKSPNEIVEACKKILKNQQFAENIGRKASETVRKLYNEDSYKEKLLSFYNELE